VCSFEGIPYPTQLCPGGSYCESKTVVNQINNTVVQSYFRPALCWGSTYCLDGVYTPEVDPNNP